MAHYKLFFYYTRESISFAHKSDPVAFLRVRLQFEAEFVVLSQREVALELAFALPDCFAILAQLWRLGELLLVVTRPNLGRGSIALELPWSLRHMALCEPRQAAAE